MPQVARSAWRNQGHVDPSAPLPLAWLGALVVSAALGCLLGRWAGPRLGWCPYVFSAGLGALGPTLVGLAGADARLMMVALLAALGATVGTFLSGHNSRWRAIAMASTGAAAAALLGRLV